LNGFEIERQDHRVAFLSLARQLFTSLSFLSKKTRDHPRHPRETILLFEWF
jgi:hypothetical protein